MGNGTSIGRVRGLGSSHSGAHHMLMQRFSAIGIMLLSAFLIVSFVLLPDLSYGTVSDWIAKPLPATAVALLLIGSFWHARIGMQVVVEDYVQDSGLRYGTMLAIDFATILGTGYGLFSILRIALGGA